MEQGRDVLGKLMLQRRIIGYQDFRDAFAFRRRIRNYAAGASCHENMNLAVEFFRRTDHIQCCRAQGFIIVLR